ncbi:MAG: rod shape-determining protein MreC [Solirubrobacterales bacterium]|nr:rod shape-determining protein MreC [Solirubrobacterales bacterium]
MYDRTVRRRRAVLLGLVALSLILLTAYFGESAGGGLHSVQRGALSVLAPVQEGANRALKPVRDLFGWAGDTVDAKQERDDLVKRNRALEALVNSQQVELSQYDQIKKIVDVNAQANLDRFAPVTARVISQTPSLFYSEIKIDKGSSAGVALGQPVTGGGGLVGRVSRVAGNAAAVTLITDEEFAVAARTLKTKVPGTIRPEVGAPGDLILDFVSQRSDVDRGERIVTAGTTSPRLPSLFPPGIPIGKVRRVEDGAGDLDREVHVRPAADMSNLQFVAVLTETQTGDLTAAATP